MGSVIALANGKCNHLPGHCRADSKSQGDASGRLCGRVESHCLPYCAPKDKRIIYLFQNGAPSQLESFDYKPLLAKMTGEELPASIRMGQRLTGMTSGQAKFPLVGSKFSFKQYGSDGVWIS